MLHDNISRRGGSLAMFYSGWSGRVTRVKLRRKWRVAAQYSLAHSGPVEEPAGASVAENVARNDVGQAGPQPASILGATEYQAHGATRDIGRRLAWMEGTGWGLPG